jgi:PAS domain S-box-containing protein
MSGTDSVQYSRRWISSRVLSPAAVGVVCAIVFVSILKIPLKDALLGGAVSASATFLAMLLVLRRADVEQTRILTERNRMFELSMDMICVAGFDGYLKEVNPAFERITGWSREEWCAIPFIERTHPDDRNKVTEVMKSLSESNPLLDFESRTLCKNGMYKWISTSSFPVVKEGVVYAVCRDITDRKHSEQTIVQLNAQLQARADMVDAVNKELEAFSYSISHDLRAPLRHVVGFVQLLKKNAADRLDESNRQHLTVIENSTHNMATMIDALLEFARLGKTEPHWTAVNLLSLVQETLAPLIDDTKSRSIEWTIHPLPVIHGDKALLKMALNNLIGNAVKYTRDKEPARIEVGTLPAASYNLPEEQVVLYVKDNGVGFDMQYAGRLFAVFQRLHSASGFEGTGIGLANVKRIVSRHGGRVWAEGKPGEGATFFISLRAVTA